MTTVEQDKLSEGLKRLNEALRERKAQMESAERKAESPGEQIKTLLEVLAKSLEQRETKSAVSVQPGDVPGQVHIRFSTASFCVVMDKEEALAFAQAIVRTAAGVPPNPPPPGAK